MVEIRRMSDGDIAFVLFFEEEDKYVSPIWMCNAS